MPPPKWNRRLRDAFKKAGLQQKELAFRAGVPASSLSRLFTAGDPDPQISTLIPILRELGLTFGEVFDGDAPINVRATPYDRDKDYRLLIDLAETLTPERRKKLIGFATWIASEMAEWIETNRHQHAPSLMIADAPNVLEFVPFRPKLIDESRYEFPVPPEEFKARDFDYPQPWHYWTGGDTTEEEEVPGLAAGSRGVPNLLNPRIADVREVIDRVNQIVRIEGDSMESSYFDGDLVRVDTRLRSPERGQPIAVYCDDLGGSLIGFYKRSGERVVLVKENKPKYQDVVLPESGWLLVGTVVELVRRPARRGRV